VANVNELYVATGVKGWLEIDAPTTSEQIAIDIVVSNACSAIKTIRRQDMADDIETKYRDLAIEMAVYQYEKKGVDGVNSFSENSISRVYEKGTYPSSMLRRITPKPNVIKRTGTVI